MASLAAWDCFALVGAGEVGDVVDGVVVADVLEGVGDGLDEVVLLDDCHGRVSPCSLLFDSRMSGVLLSRCVQGEARCDGTAWTYIPELFAY